MLRNRGILIYYSNRQTVWASGQQSRSQDGSQALANWRSSGLPRAVRAPGVVEGTRRFKDIGAVEHTGIGLGHSAGGRGQGALPLGELWQGREAIT